jgi:hypothetical protein
MANERIKELMGQALDEKFAGTWSVMDLQDLTKFADRFAELIVRECAEIALEQKKWVEDMKVHNPHDEVWNKARIQQSQHIVDKIKEHFGIEE